MQVFNSDNTQKSIMITKYNNTNKKSFKNIKKKNKKKTIHKKTLNNSYIIDRSPLKHCYECSHINCISIACIDYCSNCYDNHICLDHCLNHCNDCFINNSYCRNHCSYCNDQFNCRIHCINCDDQYTCYEHCIDCYDQYFCHKHCFDCDDQYFCHKHCLDCHYQYSCYEHCLDCKEQFICHKHCFDCHDQYTCHKHCFDCYYQDCSQHCRVNCIKCIEKNQDCYYHVKIFKQEFKELYVSEKYDPNIHNIILKDFLEYKMFFVFPLAIKLPKLVQHMILLSLFRFPIFIENTKNKENMIFNLKNRFLHRKFTHQKNIIYKDFYDFDYPYTYCNRCNTRLKVPRDLSYIDTDCLFLCKDCYNFTMLKKKHTIESAHEKKKNIYDSDSDDNYDKYGNYQSLDNESNDYSDSDTDDLVHIFY